MSIASRHKQEIAITHPLTIRNSIDVGPESGHRHYERGMSGRGGGGNDNIHHLGNQRANTMGLTHIGLLMLKVRGLGGRLGDCQKRAEVIMEGKGK